MKQRPQSIRRDYSALIEQVLAPYGVWQAGDDKWRAACPIHKGENNTSFSIFGNGKWRCFKCGAWGDLARLLVHCRRLTLKQAQEYIGSAPVPFRTVADIPLPEPYHIARRKKLPYEVLRDAILAPYRRNCPRYLLGRGFSEGSLQQYEIGYDLQKAKIVIPVRDHAARLVGLTYRLDFDNDRSQTAKYWHDNFNKSFHLYGYHFWTARKLRRFYLVEGQLDAVRLYQLGYAAAAIMGSEISKEQVDVLKATCQASQIVLAFDNDEAGYKARKDAIQKLTKTRFAKTLGILKYPGNDPGELRDSGGIEVLPWGSCLLS